MILDVLHLLGGLGVEPTFFVLLWLLYDQQQRINDLEAKLDHCIEGKYALDAEKPTGGDGL